MFKQQLHLIFTLLIIFDFINDLHTTSNSHNFKQLTEKEEYFLLDQKKN